MKKLIGIVMILLLAASLTACFALSEPEEASGVAVAPTIAADTQTEAPLPEEVMPEPTEAADTEAEAETEAEVEVDTEPETESEEMVEPTGSGTYDIDPSQSEARFTIEEVLRGDDVTVVGVSSNLAGQIAFDMANPAATQMGEIVINARSFATDNDFRNRAIANEILLTDAHEFITFAPKELVGLPDSAAVGETYNFQVMGDLTIIGETREETFEVTVTVTSETELQGTASASILYADYGVTVPLSQFVTAVNEDVLLELDFVAVAQ